MLKVIYLPMLMLHLILTESFIPKQLMIRGIAGLNIRLYPGNYIITAINPVNGEQIGNKVIVKPNIADNKELVKYFRNASQYSVKLLNNDGSKLLWKVKK